jgi:adenine-specific DNA-methyltransferase
MWKWLRIRRARALRRACTPSEARLWSAIRNRQLGAKFRRQHPLGPFILDFFCAEEGVVIEVDGSSHVGREEQDRRRDAWLSCGLTVLRFTNDEVLYNLADVLRRIRLALDTGTSPPGAVRPSPLGEGQRGHLAASG